MNAVHSALAERRPVADYDAEPVVAWLATRLGAIRNADKLVSLSIPAPAATPETLLRLVPREHGFLWHPPTAAGVSGAGIAARIDLRGRARFDDLRRGAQALWRQLENDSYPGCRPPSPRLFGGLAFASGASSEVPWRAFGDGCFTLPRWRYAVKDDRAILTLTVRGGEVRGGTQPWLLRIRTILDSLARAEAGGNGAPTPLPRVTRMDAPSRTRWSEQVEAIRSAIIGGGFEKIVAANRTVVTFDAVVDALSALDRLANGLRSSTRFAFIRDDATFFGATPERLIALRGLRFETESLAGSLAVGDAPATQLLSSGKDLEEHRLVVTSIVRRLEPLVARLDVASEPRVRTLREVLHLHTPIRGELNAPRHVLDLVELLHPTPAVGGVPTDEAMRWITENEPEGRGWYAGPIGWFDHAGAGEFAVALRTCLLRGRRAYLYAGAGIVADSDPVSEYAETEVKRKTLLRSLGMAN